MSNIPASTASNLGLETKKYHIPIVQNDISDIDGTFNFAKERFKEEMKEIEEEMEMLSKNLVNLYNEANTYQTALHQGHHKPSCFWEFVANSPLVEGEGFEKTLKLQFDLSEFEPAEVEVKIVEETLVVTAQHLDKTSGKTLVNQYNREFKLPSGVEPTSVKSFLSKDGVLVVKVPLNVTGLYIDNEYSLGF